MVYLIDPEKLTSTTNAKPCRIFFPVCPKDFYHPLYGIITGADE